MKKLSIILALILLPLVASAAGTVVVTPASIGEDKGVDIRTLTFTWTADAAAATVPATALTADELAYVKGMYCIGAETNPGAVAPDALYDITVSQSGFDISGGTLADRSATATERAYMQIGTTPLKAWVTDTLTVAWANVGVNSSTGTLILYFER